MKITLKKEHNDSFRKEIIPFLEKNKTEELHIHYPRSIKYSEITFFDTLLYLYSDINVIVDLIGFPLCVLPSRDYSHFLKKYKGCFIPKCEKCKERNNCFGIPKDYLRKFGGEEIKPFTQEDYILVDNWRKDKKEVKKIWDIEKKRQGVIWDNYFKDIKGKILDVGAGIGVFLSFDKKRIFGIDADENKVNNALRKKGLHLKVGDAKKLDFKSNSFSAIYCNFVLEHLSFNDAKKALKEMRRVLKPRGKLFIIVAGCDEGSYWYDINHVNLFTKKILEKLAREFKFKKYNIFNSMFIRKYKGFDFKRESSKKKAREIALCLIAEK